MNQVERQTEYDALDVPVGWREIQEPREGAHWLMNEGDVSDRSLVGRIAEPTATYPDGVWSTTRGEWELQHDVEQPKISPIIGSINLRWLIPITTHRFDLTFDEADDIIDALVLAEQMEHANANAAGGDEGAEYDANADRYRAVAKRMRSQLRVRVGHQQARDMGVL